MPPPTTFMPDEEEHLQKRTEYADHYIKNAQAEGDKVTLNHTKQEPSKNNYLSHNLQ